MRQRIITAAATVGAALAVVLAGAGIASANVIGGTGTGGGCGGGPDITWASDGSGFTLYAGTVQLPGGPATNIYGQALFVTHCQPQSGTVYLDMQMKTIPNGVVFWQPEHEVSRNIGQTLPRGWSLYSGGVFCSGRHTWRWVLTWHGVASDGTTESSPPGGLQYPSASGKIFQCLNYGG